MIDFSTSNRIYDQLQEDSGIKLYRFDGLDIPFNPSWKKIGMNLSGGADSSCLLTLLSKIITDNNFNVEVHVISHIRCWNERPWQGPIALDVFKKFVKDYPSIKFYRHTNYIPPELEWGVIGPITTDETGRPRSGDQICVGSFNKYIAYREKFDAIFNATSANPTEVSWEGGMKNREKSASEGVLSDLVLLKKNQALCHPFRFVDKSWIVAEYHRLDKLDLYNLTRSCEGDINHKTIKSVVTDLESYDPAIHTVETLPTCGDCWWCKERSWAESKLDDTLREMNNE